jgi:hypothetical protein
MQTEKERVFKILSDQPQFNRERHGSLWDRGSADSYYGRQRGPHWWPEGTGNGTKIVELTDAERQEYDAGYDYNEEYGDRKNWGD